MSQGEVANLATNSMGDRGFDLQGRVRKEWRGKRGNREAGACQAEAGRHCPPAEDLLRWLTAWTCDGTSGTIPCQTPPDSVRAKMSRGREDVRYLVEYLHGAVFMASTRRHQGLCDTGTTDITESSFSHSKLVISLTVV